MPEIETESLVTTELVTTSTKETLNLDESTDFICSICNAKFDSKLKLTRHRGDSHGSKKHQCMKCGSGFTTTRGLRLHLRLHTGLKSEKCLFCSKTFTDPRNKKFVL